MEKPIEKPQGLIARISTLLNNEVCSDVVFHVKHNGQRRMFYAHSPVLVAAGKGFPDLVKQTSQPKVIKISEFSSDIVEMMLTYVYTDELNILGMENAVGLYKLACMYGIGDLEKLCSHYITKEEVNIDNLFVKYESALSCNFPKLLEKCRNLVQSETKAVFASRYFGEAPFPVVEDIFSLDHLNVSSEFDVINAAFRWSAYECRRKGRPTEKLCIRDAIDPLLKHLRFLSISADEFCDYTAKDDNIFTNFETAVLTRKILQPDYKGDFPKDLCPISKPRQPLRKTSNRVTNMNNFSDFYSEPTTSTTSMVSEPVYKNTLKDHYSELGNKNNFKDPSYATVRAFDINDLYYKSENKTAFQSPNPEPIDRSNLIDRYSEPVKRNNFNDAIADRIGNINFNDYLPESPNGNSSSSSSAESVNSLKSGQEDASFFRQSFNKTPPTLKKVEQKPIFQYNQKKTTPMLKVMPQQVPFRRTFDFPLQEMRKGIRFASLKDIKCNAKIEMLAGVILIHGIELKISEQKQPNEPIEVHSCITFNYNNPSKSETYNLELKKSMLSLMYKDPIRVAPGNPADIEITIEDLHLNRCFVCQGQTYELNTGLKVNAKISVKSNQSNGQDNVLYLINRIIYSVTP